MKSGAKKIIAIDLDDVLAASAAGFVEWSNKRYGTNLVPNDYDEHWSRIWKTEHDETTRRASEYIASGTHREHAPIEGAYEALRRLKERFSLVIITSRRSSMEKLTREWLQTHYPDTFDNVSFSGFYDAITEASFAMTKGGLAKTAGADYLIDDQIKHVTAAAEHGIKGILFGDYGWNKTDALPQGVVRATDWDEVLEYFRNI